MIPVSTFTLKKTGLNLQNFKNYVLTLYQIFGTLVSESEEQQMEVTMDMALALEAGGWSHNDKEELMREYEFTEEEAEQMCQLLEMAEAFYD